MRKIEIRCMNNAGYSKGFISVDLTNKMEYQIEYARGKMMKKLSLHSNIKNTYVALSSKHTYSSENMKTEINSIGDKLREEQYGDNIMVYRGCTPIYGYDNKSAELNWIYESLNSKNFDFEFDETSEYDPKASMSILRRGDGSAILKKFRTIWGDKVKISSQVLTLKKEHSRFQNMYDLLVSKNISDYIGVTNKGIEICNDLFTSVLYHLRVDNEFIGEKVISKKNKKAIHDGFIYDKDMMWLGAEEDSRYNSHSINTYIYFMDDIKEVEGDTFANRTHNKNKKDRYFIITPNSINLYTGEMERVVSLVIDESHTHSKIITTLFNGEWIQNMGRIRNDEGEWLCVEVIAEGSPDKTPYFIKLYKPNGVCIAGHGVLSSYIARVEESTIPDVDKDTTEMINHSLLIKDNDDIIYKSNFRRNVGALSILGYVERTLSPNMIIKTPFDLQVIQTPIMVIKNEPDDKPELIFNCVIDGDLLPTLQNALSVINKESVYHDMFKSIVEAITNTVSVSDFSNPNLISTKIYNYFVDMYNGDDKSSKKLVFEVNDSILFGYELKKFVAGEIKEIQMKISYREAKEVLEKFGFEVHDRDHDGDNWRWETNGWQCDYWTFAMKDGIKYDIQGCLYNNDFSITLTEDGHDQ